MLKIFMITNLNIHHLITVKQQALTAWIQYLLEKWADVTNSDLKGTFLHISIP